MLQLAWPWLAIGVLLPVLVARALPPASAPGVALRVPFFSAVPAVSAKGSRAFKRIGVLLACVAWLALVLAACRPQWVDEPLGLPVTGRGMLLALDVSASMQRADMQAAQGGAQESTRLQVVQRSARAFIQRRVGDRMGLILFGSKPYLQCPLTFDRTTLARMVDDTRVGLAGELTSLGDAIALAVKHLRALPGEQRTLILLTDGANTSGVMEPLDAARLARHHSVRVYTIAVGTPAAESPSAISLTGADHALLQRIAGMTGGRHFRATNTADLERIYVELDALEPVARGEQRFRPLRELYHWPLGVAVFLGVVVLLGIGRRTLLQQVARVRASPSRSAADPSARLGYRRHG